MLVITKNKEIVEFAHNVRPINWNEEATKIMLTKKEFDDKLNELAVLHKTHSKDSRRFWFNKVWRYDEAESAIYYSDGEGRYFIYYCSK